MQNFPNLLVGQQMKILKNIILKIQNTLSTKGDKNMLEKEIVAVVSLCLGAGILPLATLGFVSVKELVTTAKEMRYYQKEIKKLLSGM